MATFYAAVYHNRKCRIRKFDLRVRDHEPVWPGPIALKPRLFERLRDCLAYVRQRADTGRTDTSNTDTGRLRN